MRLMRALPTPGLLSIRPGSCPRRADPDAQADKFAVSDGPFGGVYSKLIADPLNVPFLTVFAPHVAAPA
jgi:hypothetical protein